MVQVTGSRWPRPAYSLLVTGLARVALDRVVQESPFPVGEVTQIEVPTVDLDEPMQNRMITFKEKAMELLELLEGSGPAVRRIKVGNLVFFLQNGVTLSSNICVAICCPGAA